MKPDQPRFALNHMCAPAFDIDRFFDMAMALGCGGVEIRNDLAGNAILDGTPPDAVRQAAQQRGLTIISINALQRFNDWNEARGAEARTLAQHAKACGAKALVLVPTNDGTGLADGERQARLLTALRQLRPILEETGIQGLVEPLGFESCSLRRKSEAAEAIGSRGARGTFSLVHDTFHHHLAGETELFPEMTGLVHISGVTEPTISVAEMRDPHRVLVGAGDRLDNVGQIAALLSGGYAGSLSFEPFAPSVHRLPEPARALSASMEFIRSRLANRQS